MVVLSKWSNQSKPSSSRQGVLQCNLQKIIEETSIQILKSSQKTAVNGWTWATIMVSATQIQRGTTIWSDRQVSLNVKSYRVSHNSHSHSQNSKRFKCFQKTYSSKVRKSKRNQHSHSSHNYHGNKFKCLTKTSSSMIPLSSKWIIESKVN